MTGADFAVVASTRKFRRARAAQALALAAGCLIVFSLVGCAPAVASPSAGVSPSVAEVEPSTVPSDAGGYVTVQIPGWDGEMHEGRLFGRGSVGIVLSHMGRSRDTQEDWAQEARRLASGGYLVLTYQRDTSYGNVWREVLDGAAFLRSQGAQQIVAGGASIGAMGSLYAAEQRGSELNGVIWLAGILLGSGYDFDRADVARLHCPMLFMSGDEDVYGAADDARQLDSWATAPHDLLIVSSGEHGTDILAVGGRPADQVRSAIDVYLRDLRGFGGTCARDA